jgi:hypothetical protein
MVKAKAKFAVMTANNHYANFGPASANPFAKEMGLK